MSMTPVRPTSGGRPSWFRRHKILTTTAVVLLVAVGLSEDTDTTPVDAAGTTESSAPDSSPDVRPILTDDSTEKQKATAKTKQKATAKTKQKTATESAKTPVPRPQPSARTYLVTHVVDGDTIDLANGESVRIVGIDTPERGDCNYDNATALMERLVLGKRVRLTVSDEDRDRYGRLLRYVDVGRTDAGLRMVKAGFAIARYDSRDGYGYHPRERRYIAADAASRDRTCSKPAPVPLAQTPSGQCEPGYDPCVPPYPRDLDCADVDGPIRVTGPDPHGLDGEGDGIACE